MVKKELLYEGKAKKMYKTDDPNMIIVEYKNDLTAFNALKKDSIEGKGSLNNAISASLFEYMNENGIPNHFIQKIDDTHQIVKKVRILPVEVVVRNITTGTLCKRLGIEENIRLPRPLIEFYYKNDQLGDPLILEDHAELFGWATKEQISFMKETSLKVNTLMSAYFDTLNIILVDFKLEFGVDANGTILLADEMSPDTCRFWDKTTMKKLDKDRFRKDLGDVLGAYREIWRRISEKEAN
ncbi:MULTISPECIES: phosphoribosylaminoimidazolesuccinocarboxamide synthase [Aminobacterium]|jgi:phosphoribosylaminoimidazole-succinocarboxamide synthase|uniref:Phosphoribosylaminoimidazole-succinocarboxamide synthase n=1 Tax=Aminobacterium colombiense (strain DSM 12261 / ALA-1) TaxID=572547 RepID=D5EFF3_AMICL|nr:MULTISPECIES: phosphoribosylaminoimidazolesuccinocarboxamide synthase [Aminobacterium]MDD2378430.1 phosphoribosylaminoimidazolesuccinocarboxamide synthase [Aminobacterium colombiense]ADE57285.1 phosphoribosylaminoimidazole-succinocarboxamide synthase [Aminobacterium colombiense DSM 12261]MDD3767402.1 phosphoribosylaminoimidazolesuccinocarboxamide synthase [Aminobacterium colombiense]MDD4264893.1 phosphoribosylaminoimidazolesuccinocarboxamide synthase [Aminobacterium colombiense]MDD4586178.1